MCVYKDSITDWKQSACREACRCGDIDQHKCAKMLSIMTCTTHTMNVQLCMDGRTPIEHATCQQ